jgi:excisionase family DNA binding protein
VTASPAPEVERGEPTYLTAEQVGALLQCSPKSVFRWAAEDPTMPVIRIGRTVRFPRAKLEQWLSARTQGAGRARQRAVDGAAGS